MNAHIHTLADGRALCYALYGPVDGRPVLYLHGTPSSRLEPLLLNLFGHNLEALLTEAGVRLIAVDRPGMGLSTYNPRNTFLSTARDLAELCAVRHTGPLPVLCWSGGGPYALAFAWAYPELARAVHILCGFTHPFDAVDLQLMGLTKWYFYGARYTPWVLKAAFPIVRRQEEHRMPPQWLTGVAWEDYDLMRRPGVFSAMARLTAHEAARRGPQGPVTEARSYFGPFGYRLSEITQPIHYWWGSRDMAVSRSHAESVEREAPRARMHYREGEGHLSLYVNTFAAALQLVLSADVPAS